MTGYPFIYICSHAGKIGNIRWVNSDTRQGYWGRWGYVDPCPDEDDLRACRCPELLILAQIRSWLGGGVLPLVWYRLGDWSGALAGPPRDDPDWSDAMSEALPRPAAGAGVSQR
jgi:hypothetical protein